MRAHADPPGNAPGFLEAVVDPHINALACAALPRAGQSSDRVGTRHLRTIAIAIERGPDALTEGQKLLVLTDPVALAQLHRHVATSPTAHPAWRLPKAS